MYNHGLVDRIFHAVREVLGRRLTKVIMTIVIVWVLFNITAAVVGIYSFFADRK